MADFCDWMHFEDKCPRNLFWSHGSDWLHETIFSLSATELSLIACDLPRTSPVVCQCQQPILMCCFHVIKNNCRTSWKEFVVRWEINSEKLRGLHMCRNAVEFQLWLAAFSNYLLEWVNSAQCVWTIMLIYLVWEVPRVLYMWRLLTKFQSKVCKQQEVPSGFHVYYTCKKTRDTCFVLSDKF